MAKISHYASPEEERVAKAMKPTEGKALIYVVMTSMYSEQIVVYDDSNYDPTLLVQKAYYMAQIEPGKRKIVSMAMTRLTAGSESINSALAKVFSFDAEPGQTYYFVTSLGPVHLWRTCLAGGGYVAKKIFLSPIEPEEGREYVNQYRLSKTAPSTEKMKILTAELLEKMDS